MKSCVGISIKQEYVCVCVSVVCYICCLAKKMLKLIISNSYWLPFLSLTFLDFLPISLLVSNVSGSGKRDLTAQNLRYRLHIGKILSFSIFVFCRISLSDHYSTSMPNFKCQNNLKDPKRAKRAMERQATFYSLSFSKYNKRGMGEVSKKQL